MHQIWTQSCWKIQVWDRKEVALLQTGLSQFILQVNWSFAVFHGDFVSTGKQQNYVEGPSSANHPLHILLIPIGV